MDCFTDSQVEMRVTERKCCVRSKTGQSVAEFAGVPKFGRGTSPRYGGCANNPGAIKMRMHPTLRANNCPIAAGCVMSIHLPYNCPFGTVTYIFVTQSEKKA